MFSLFQPESISIKVVGRCRPLTAEENKKGAKVGVSVSGDKIIVQSGKVSVAFSSFFKLNNKYISNLALYYIKDLTQIKTHCIAKYLNIFIGTL